MSAPETAPAPGRSRTAAAIVEAAARLLGTGGPGAVTTRAVAAEAGVQAPAIYRLFGDKDGLLDAVAEHVFATYVTDKARTERLEDPVEDLRAGWETHIGFGLANPALAALLADPTRGRRSPAVVEGMEVLRRRVDRIAVAGRLRVPERRAVELIHAAGTGAVLALLATPEDERDLGLAEAAYEGVTRVILTDEAVVAGDGLAAAAVALRARLPGSAVLSDPERALMAEWLDRLASG